jgi:hypothetical protein
VPLPAAGISPDYRVITPFPGGGHRLRAWLRFPGPAHLTEAIAPGRPAGPGSGYDMGVSFPGYDMDVS